MEINTSGQKEAENKKEILENASDRESSVESFHTNKSELSITTEAELIDVDEIELSDEESWLYQSPKKVPNDEKSISTEKWLQCHSEEMDDVELKETRHALVSKLNELKKQGSRGEIQPVRKKFQTSTPDPPTANKEVDDSTNSLHGNLLSSIESEKFVDGEKSDSKPLANSQTYDAVDVHKIARLQEESLKQSTYKFLNNSGKRTPNSQDLSPASPTQVLNLSKPASIEALNVHSDKLNQCNGYSVIPLQSMKKQNIFGSPSAINTSQEIHRGSLPNIAKGYYSLKSKKSKRPSEPKVSCPLPIYPIQLKTAQNESVLKDQRQSSTLPSSYRVNSRRNSSSHRDMSSLSPSPRRESKPFVGSNSSLSNQRREHIPTGNGSPLSSPRRESLPYKVNFSPLSSPRKEFMPYIGSSSPLLNQRRESSPYTGDSSLPSHRENHRKYSSPVPSTRYTTSAAISQTKNFMSLQGLRSPPGADLHRAPSHSPSRRLPLSTVQQVSTKKENSPTSPRNGDIRVLPVKIGSKIPGPGMRSARSVSSTRAVDDPWNEDCY